MKKIDNLIIANKKFKSRLIVGTGKYKNFEETANAVQASGADIVTVAVRRVNILNKDEPLLMDYINPKSITYLPNTAGCYTSEEALRTLRLAREMGDWRLVKLEVLGDKKTLYPNMIETIKSTEILVKEGFEVMVYCTDDPIMTKKLEDVGALAAGDIGFLCGLPDVQIGDILGEPEPVPGDYALSEPLLSVKVRPIDETEHTPLAKALQQLASEDPHLNFRWYCEEREPPTNHEPS